jgi:hypothetical protein
MEMLMDGDQVLTLCRTVGATPLSELVGVVGTPMGREMLKAHLDSEPFPHFEAHPALPGMLIRTEANGETSVGRFVNREFVTEAHVVSGVA